MYLKYFSKIFVIFLILSFQVFAQDQYKKGELLINFNNQGKDITLTDSKSTQTTGISSIDKMNKPWASPEVSTALEQV